MTRKINCQTDILISEILDYSEYLKKNGIKPSHVLVTPENAIWEIVLEYVKSQRIRRPKINYRRRKKPLRRRLIKKNKFMRLR